MEGGGKGERGEEIGRRGEGEVDVYTGHKLLLSPYAL